MARKGESELRTLVTGGAGYIGGTVAQLLLDRGREVTIYDNLCHGHRSMLPTNEELIVARQTVAVLTGK